MNAYFAPYYSPYVAMINGYNPLLSSYPSSYPYLYGPTSYLSPPLVSYNPYLNPLNPYLNPLNPYYRYYPF